MLRKLASIQVIESLEPIEGADRILKARVMGWTVVVAKGEFAPGDQCVFFEVDAVLPETAPWAAFMRPRGFRVKTCTLRGVLSQGLALPLAVLPPGHGPVEVGQEVTEALGVTKHEPEVPLGVEAAGAFPALIPKSDEIRLQSALGLLDELRGLPFYVTVKCDGTSSTVARLGGELVVCSRNLALKPGADNPYWRVATRYELGSRLPEGFAVQGEVCGPKLQKNRLELPDHDLFVFNVFDVKQGRYLDFADFVAFCRDLRLTTVPVERVVDGDELVRFELSLPRLLELAEGTYAGTKNRREGIVVRPLVERRSETLGGSRLSFKVLNNAYLLRDES